MTVGYSSPNITIETIGGGNPVERFLVDTFSVPGTNPVVPNAFGTVIVTGGQYVSGTFGTRVITINSATTNSFTVQAQISAANAGPLSTKNGISHFDSAFFTVSAIGFVSAAGTGFIKTITGTTGGAISPTANNINLLAAVVAAGTTPLAVAGAASTLTINAQISQALAATDATKIGLSNFSSANFAVDANGFVTSANSGFPWIDQGSSITLAVNKNYFVTAATTQTLPAAPAQGDTIIVQCVNAGPIVVTANTGQFIRISTGLSSSAGTATNSAIGDSLTLTYRSTTLTWHARAVMGNFTLA